MNDSATFRDKEQILLDLAKALNFSVQSLEMNRKGRLASDQFSALIGSFFTPLVASILLAAAPFFCWGLINSSGEHVSFSAGVQIFLGQLAHLGDVAENLGKFAVISRVGSLLLCLGVAGLIGSRISLGLYFDLIEGSVRVVEGRVVAREDQTIRPNGRDPIEKYYFDVKTDRFPVSLAAYRALETGSVYLLYLLPRSRQLVAIEPKP